MPDTDTGIYTKIERIDVRLDQHENILDDHGLQLRLQTEQIKQLQDNGLRLENIVMSENQATRLTITSTNNQLHELIKGLMGYKTGQSQLSTTLSMAKWESMAKIVGLLAGSGGILYYIFGK